MQVGYRHKSSFWSNSWLWRLLDVRSAKNIYRRRSWVYDTVGHAPLAIDRLLDVQITKWQRPTTMKTNSVAYIKLCRDYYPPTGTTCGWLLFCTLHGVMLWVCGPFIATQLNSTQLNWTQLDVELSTRSQREQLSPINERSDPVDSVCRSWRHKQNHDWLGCTLFNWISWVQLSCVAVNTPLVRALTTAACSDCVTP